MLYGALGCVLDKNVLYWVHAHFHLVCKSGGGVKTLVLFAKGVLSLFVFFFQS